MPVDAVPIVEQMCQRWTKSYDEFCQAYRDTFAPGAEYVAQHQMPATQGADQAVAVLDQFHAGFGVETVEVDMIRIAQVGNDVWTERVDYMVNAAGERFLAIPIMGVMTFNDEGLITRWIDYWDMRELLALAPTGSE